MTSFFVLVPTALTDAMLSSSTIAEPAAGETAWVSAGTYVLGDVRIRTTTHRKYSALIGHTGRTALPEADPTYWEDIGPTNRWAPFDAQISTPCAATTSFTYVLRPGFFNAVSFYGLNGAAISISVKDAPGGAVVFSYTGDLFNLPLDWYDYAFGVIRSRDRLFVSGITPYPDAELTITISAGSGVPVGVGLIVIGDLRPFLGDAEWGGTQQGASAEPVNYSRIETDDFGNTRIVKRRSVTDMRLSVAMPREVADFFLANVQDVLSTPAAVIATDAPGYDGLNVFGLLSGSLSYDSFNTAIFNGYVKGLV
jgi:hypothetical protein